MKTRSTFGAARAVFRATGLAAALAGCAGAALAGESTLKITSFTASAAEFSGLFVFATDPFQSFGMTALNGGGLYGQAVDNYSDASWNLGLNRSATTSNANAVGNLVAFTDASSGLTTAGFNLAAQAGKTSYGPTALPNYADASAVQSGTFTLLDEAGRAAAGTITFDVYYDLSVAGAGGGSPSLYAQTVLNLLASSDAGTNRSFDDGLLSSSLAGGTGSTSGHFAWSYTLAAGESAYYTLSGSAIAVDALATVAAVPEPGTYALTALGLAGLGVWARRRPARPASTPA